MTCIRQHLFRLVSWHLDSLHNQTTFDLIRFPPLHTLPASQWSLPLVHPQKRSPSALNYSDNRNW